MVDELKLEHEDYHTSGTTTDLGLYCRDLFTEYEGSSYRQRKLKEIEEGRKRYRNDRPEKTYPFKKASNKSLGLEAIAIDNLEPRMVNKLIGEDDFIQVKPTAEDDVEKVEDVREFMHWATLQNMKLKPAIKPIVHDLLMDGTKFVFCLWEEKEVISRVRGMMPVFIDEYGARASLPPGVMSSGGPEQVMAIALSMGLRPAGAEEGFREKASTDFKVQVEALKIEDCFFPDHNDKWEEQPFMRKIYPQLGDLVELREAGVYKNITNKLVKGARRNTTDDEDNKEIQYSEYGQECELLECFVKWKGEWVIATFSPDAGWEEVRRQKLSEVFWHGRKVIQRFRIYGESNESMGTGIPKKIEQLSKGMNDLYNQMIDAGTIEIIPFYFFNQSSTGMLSSKTHEIAPGKGIPIPKDSQVTFPNVGGKSAMFIQFINLLLTFFERTLSLMDYSAGTRSSTTGQGGDTASGMNMILQEGNIKHNYTGETIQDVFAELLTDALSLYAQNIPMTAKIRLFQNNKWLFKPVNIQALEGRYDIAIDISDASSNTMTNRNEKLALNKLLAANPAVNTVQLTQDLLQAFGIRSTEKYINPAFGTLSAALQEFPELANQIAQFVQQYAQKKQAETRRQEIAGQAEANIERQAIEREVEAPYENQKLVDQANESYKRKIVGQIVEAIGGIKEQPAGMPGQAVA